MSSETAIRVSNLSKCYLIYDSPGARLKQSLFPRLYGIARPLSRLFGRDAPVPPRFYREFWALRDVSFEIRKGDTVGIIGCNGSGKSTLLQLICGTLSQTRGQIETSGRMAALLELGAGFNPEFTGRENVYLNAGILGLTNKQIDERYEDIVAFADIGDFVNQPVKTYSSGMYVRLAFATAISVSPDILLVDEVLAVGDIRFQQKCIARIKELCRSGTVIFVSHDITAVTELCTRVIWIDSGRIRMDSLPKFVGEKYIQYMYEGISKNSLDPAGSGPEPAASDPADMLNFSSLSSDVRQFGNRRATIEAVRISSGESVNGFVYAGEPCEIDLILSSHDDIDDAIVGYLVKDRIGRELLGDNTSLMHQDIPSLKKGGKYRIRFRINNWPNLQGGDYALSVAIAQGTMAEHDQCHWVHDAVVFRSVNLRPPAGLFSVPDTSVSFAYLRD
jgi:lipopolysaccharide transport system ATP-binding protein